MNWNFYSEGHGYYMYNLVQITIQAQKGKGIPRKGWKKYIYKCILNSWVLSSNYVSMPYFRSKCILKLFRVNVLK